MDQPHRAFLNRNSLTTAFDIAASIAIICAAVLLVKTTLTLSNVSKRPAAPSLLLPEHPIAVRSVSSMGQSSAPLAMIIYSDFQCPFCAAFAKNVFPEIRSRYVTTGLLVVTFLHLPLQSIHADALLAAEAAECAGRQGQFWPMHDALFQEPRQLDRDSLLARAHRIGLASGTFSDCLDGGALEVVRGDEADARRLGLTGTPAFLLGRRLPNGRVKVMRSMLGNVSLEQLTAEIENVKVARD